MLSSSSGLSLYLSARNNQKSRISICTQYQTGCDRETRILNCACIGTLRLRFGHGLSYVPSMVPSAHISPNFHAIEGSFTRRQFNRPARTTRYDTIVRRFCRVDGLRSSLAEEIGLCIYIPSFFLR